MELYLSCLVYSTPGPGTRCELNHYNMRTLVRLDSTHWLQMEKSICWSRKVISSAISRALSVEMFSMEGTRGGFISSCRMSLLLPASSFFRSRRSWVAALCSAGNRLELHTMSSRNSVVKYLSLEPSKSCRSVGCHCSAGQVVVNKTPGCVW